MQKIYRNNFTYDKAGINRRELYVGNSADYSAYPDVDRRISKVELQPRMGILSIWGTWSDFTHHSYINPSRKNISNYLRRW